MPIGCRSDAGRMPVGVGLQRRVRKMGLADAEAVIGRFVTDTTRRLRPVALWAHGSLAAGDSQPARSALDLIVAVREPLPADQIAQFAAYLLRLRRNKPAAAKPHCSYLPLPAAGDTSESHFT